MMRGAGSGRVAEYDEARNRLRAALAERLRLDPDVIDPAEPFARYGLDSVGAAALVAELSDWLGRPISPVVVWEYPTVDALAAHLSGRAAPTVGRAAGAASTADEPIAVVGLACRFPGAPDPAAYWRLLCEGRGAIGEVPPGRWDEDLVAAVGLDGPDAAPFRRGGFLPSVDGFDAAFFRISPREAAQLDPQQRLMLELAWEALEDAGIAADALRGTPTGVFCGVIWHDYAEHHRLAGAEITLHTGVGQALGVVANRISYALGLNGPSVALDTACSSSLLALHLACQSLRSGESALALAGGVNLMLAPTTTAVLREFGGLSAEGECRPFDARANGFVRGEGAGFVVLKPLSRALADGDRIYCTIRGSAANNDGASNGLTAPNPAAQEAVLREAVHRAGISPAAVDYVEAHGTGTVLGDPIEARALGAVLGPGRAPDRPLRIGSVKGSIGHLEGAAGIAGVIKVCLMLKHRAIPPSLGFRDPNPHIAFDDLRLKVQTTLEPWPDEGRPAVAGVSSFGWGGTNCHVVLEEHRSRRAELVTLAADSPAALRRMAEALRERAADGQRDLAALRADAAVLSTLGSHRLAVVADSAGDLVRRLDAYLDGASMPGVRVGSAERAHGPLVFVYSPQGSQWLGMGRGLIAAEPVFKAVLERCDRVVRDEAGWSLLEELSADPAHSRLDEADVVQPLISCVQMALTELWRSWGVVPDVVVGHSLGEVAAAYAAGILDLEDAVRLICVYSRMQTRPECRGGKAIINLPADDAARLVEPYGGRVVVAGLNGPASTLLSGDADALDEVVAACAARSVFAARVQVNVAVHNPRFESVVADMTAALGWLRPRSARIPMVSTVDARSVAGPECQGEYWARNLRQPVLFWPVIRELLATGHRAFVEVSPHGILTHALKQAFEHEGVAGLCVPTLRRGDDERASMLDTLGALYVEGRTITINGTRADGGEDSEVAHILPLSARSAGALEDLAREFVRRLEAPGEGTARDICHTAARRRSHHEHRVAVVGRTRAELASQLEAFLNGEQSPSMAAGRVSPRGRPKVAFVFSGQGSSWWGMARNLLETEPVFRGMLTRCADLFARHLDWDLVAELNAPESESRLDRTEVAQPVLFATQVALTALWRSWGVEPDAVIGHSVGEVAAAHVAGALTLDDAVRIVAERARVTQRVPRDGRMLAVELPRSEAERLLAAFDGRVWVAAVNSPSWTVLSGDAAAVDALAASLAERDIACRQLRLEQAFHTPRVEACAVELQAAIAGIAPRAATIPMYSTVSGRVVEDGELTETYWARNLREPVLFAPAVAAALAAGCRAFVEVSAHPVLTAMVADCAAAAGTNVQALASLRRAQPGRPAMLASLGALYAMGCDVAWDGVFPAGGRFVPLPTYPWQRRRFWFDRQAPAVQRRRAAGLPGRRLATAIPTFECSADRDLLPYAADHRIGGEPVLAAAAYAELARTAAAEVLRAGHHRVEDLVIHEALVLREDERRRVQVTVSGIEDDRPTFRIHSVREADAAGGTPWTLHASGAIRKGAVHGSPEPAAMEPDAVRQRCAEDLDGAAFYTGLERRGVDIGETFRSVDRLWRGSGEALGRVMLPGGRAGGPSPAAQLLDGCLQCCLGVRAATGADDDAAYIVTRIEGVSLAAPDGVAEGARPAFWAHAQQRPERDLRAERMVVDVRIFDEARRFVGSVDGVHLRRAGKAALARLRSGGPDWHYEVAWEERPRAAGAARTGRAQALASPASIAARLDGRRSDEEKGRDADGAAAVLAELEALASQYARLALARLGFEQHAADAADAETLAARLGVAPRHTRLLRRVVEIASAGASEGVAAGADVGELAARAARLAERHPEHCAAIELLARCGAHLADVLRGDVDPLHLLFSSSAGATAETLYREEVSLRASNALVAESIAAALDGVAAGQAARILEIGAGTGATTDAVIERLAAGAAEYVFTDVTSGFVNAARDRLGRHAFMRFERLDIEASTESRPDAGTYDVVLAANVLHATQSLREALDNVRHLLAPGGLLILLETTEPRAWVDLVFGMTEGWWRFRDVERRPAHPLLAHEGWVALLADAGFEEPTAIAPARAAVLPQTLLLARAPIARPAAHGDRDRDGADPRRAGEGKRERPAACWAVFSTGSAPGREVARLLRDGGDECVLVSPGAEDGDAEPDHVRIRPGHAADCERAIRAALDGGKRLAGAVVLWPAERAADGEPSDATDRAALDCLHLLHVVRALAGATDEAKLWIVTAGAQPAGGGSEPLSPSQAALWGLGRSIASRYPRHWGGLVDLPPGELQPRDAAALVAELREPDGEDQIAYRGGRRLVARLVRAAGPDAAPPALSARATYLVTGGLGGVGRMVARWLVDRGARHLVLTGRTALPPAGSLPETSPDDELLARLAAVRELEARGATVEVVAVDVADRAAMAELLERIRAGGRPLRGVVHAAADIRPQPLDQLDDAALRSMLGPKAGGAWTLHALTRELDLDFFVLFSSTTSLLGSPELAHYAAANQFLDALAHQRAAEGLPALAIDWGTWDVMRTFSVEEQEAVARSGQNKMDAAHALDAMGRLIGQGVVQRVVADLDWSVLRPMYEARRRSAFLERMVAAGRGQVVPAAPRAGAPRAGALVERIANSRPSEAHAIVQAFVEDGVRRILGLGEAEPIDAEKGLFDMGMDSLMSIQLKGELELGVGEPLPATLTLNYPSVRALADYLADRFAGRRAPDADRVTREEAAIADGDADDELVAEIARLSDEESARLLLEELSGLAIDADEPVDR